MPPKKQEAPVVFFLHVPKESEMIEPAETQTYSEILQSVESSHVDQRFTKELMEQILDKTKSPSYGPNTACFHCCHGFSWTPSVLPICYDTYDKTYVCEGNYCSPECALADLYMMPRLSDATRWNRHSLLEDLYHPLIGLKELTPAPPRTTLRLFGGPLDIAQFRESLTTCDAQVRSDLPPIRLHMPTMNLQAPTRDVKKFVQLSHEAVEKASSELRLKRSKPVHGNVLTLDKLIKA
jgi:hypothetical protein